MSVTLAFTVEDVTTQLVTYGVIRVYRASSVGGTYLAIGTEALVALTYQYSYIDSSGDLNKFYKYSFYNTISLAESALSAPFRPDGSTLLRVRQKFLQVYRAGKVLTAVSGTVNSITVSDYRVKNTLFTSASRGKGTWVMPTTGAEAGNARVVTGLTSAGVFSVNPDWDSAIDPDVEFEWHTLIDPTEANEAARRGLRRYYYLDRIPLIGVSNEKEYSLSSLPYLTDKRHIHDVRYYPGRSGGVDAGNDAPWGSEGRWWGIRQDEGVLVLQIEPSIDSTTCLYLVVSRPMPELWDDSSSPPYPFDEDFAAALLYDEVLKMLSQPSQGNTQERDSWRLARVEHTRGTLRDLSFRNRISYNRGQPQLASPPIVPQPYQAR